MATTVEDAAGPASRPQQRSDQVVLVGHEKRYDPGVAFAHDFIRDRDRRADRAQALVLRLDLPLPHHRHPAADHRDQRRRAASARQPQGRPASATWSSGHGSHLLDTARYLGGPLTAIRARLSTKAGTYCWFLEVAYANGCLGQLDLTIAVRMDWWEGFQVYGSEGSVVGKLFNPWHLRAAEVQAFSTRDDQYHQPIGEDANVFRLQIEDLVAAATTGVDPARRDGRGRPRLGPGHGRPRPVRQGRRLGRSSTT